MKIFSLKNLCRFRLVFSFIFLLIFAGLFSGLLNSRSDMFNLPQWQFLPKVMSVAALSGITTLGGMLIIAMVTSMFGRAYCSWICPLGWLQDLLERLDRRFIRTNRKRSYQKSFYALRIAFFAVIAIWFFSGFAVIAGWVEPYSLFGKISSGVVRGAATAANKLFGMNQNGITAWSSMWFYLAVSAGFLLALAILVWCKGRIFCNTLCPAGTILSAIASRSGKRLQINTDRCINCGKCVQSCNANCINISEHRIDFANCFMCMECMASCPKDAIELVRRRKSDLVDADMPSMAERRKILLATGIAAAGALAVSKGVKKLPAATQLSDRAIVPPGAGSQERFLASCTGCGLCISNCKGKCLQWATDEYGWRGFMLPVMKFSGSNPGKCEYECTACNNICPTGALIPLSLKRKKLYRIGLAEFYSDLCLACTDDYPCGACAEHCPTGALEMVEDAASGVTIPQVNTDLCIGCGNCEFACPVRPLAAIRIKPLKECNMAADPAEHRQKQSAKQAPSAIPF